MAASARSQASRPDQTWDGINVHHVRQRLGEELAREVEGKLGNEYADVVIPVPDSSVPAAIGFSHVSGIPYNDGFIKNRYVGRTFIEPTDSLRKRGVALKFNVINENVRDKCVVMIDDSIVRGNTTGPLIKLLKKHAALMAKFPQMEHDDPNAVSVEPGKTAEFAWTFTKSGSFDFACLVPGHFEAGMKGKINVRR